MAQSQGYPSESTITSHFATQGFEEITENLTDYMQEYRQSMWAMLKRTEGAGVLSCYAPTATTVNFVAGNYVWNGEEKTFSAPANINPTDNDTTYFWLDSANTVQSAVDGTGWPSTEHLKLAEVTVDSGGNITDITDRRTMVGKLFGSGASSGVTGGVLVCKRVDSSTVEALLDTSTNNLLAVNKDDVVLKVVMATGTAAGSACSVDIGLDAAAGSPADADGFVNNANANSAGVASSEDNTYAGAYADQGGKVVVADGNITITS